MNWNQRGGGVGGKELRKGLTCCVSWVTTGHSKSSYSIDKWRGPFWTLETHNINKYRLLRGDNRWRENWSTRVIEPSPEVRLYSILTPQPSLPDCEETHASKADDFVARARRGVCACADIRFSLPPSLFSFFFSSRQTNNRTLSGSFKNSDPNRTR